MGKRACKRMEPARLAKPFVPFFLFDPSEAFERDKKKDREEKDKKRKERRKFASHREEFVGTPFSESFSLLKRKKARLQLLFLCRSLLSCYMCKHVVCR